MKYCLIFAALLFFIFSCAGTSKKNNELPAPPQFVETVEKTFDYPVLEDIDAEPASGEELAEEFPMEEFPIEEFLVEEIFENDQELYDEPEEIAETGVIEDIAASESEPLEQDEEFLAVMDEEETEQASDTDFVQTPQIAQPPLLFEPEQAPPSVPVPEQAPEAARQSPPPVSPQPLQAQTPQVAQTSPAQTPQAQISAQLPAQVQTPQPQEQLPVQSLPTLALLGPAEERDSSSAPDTYVPHVTERPVTPAQSTAVPQNDNITFSRIVRATVGQTIEIPFRGTGWVFLGELASRRGIVYNSRRLDPEGQSFIFMTEETGTYTLKFFKQDFIRDYILNDHVQVIVGEAPAAGSGWFNPPVDRGRVVAQPRWPSAQEEAEILRGGSRPGANTPPVNIPDREAGIISMPETVPSRETAQDREITAASGITSTQGTPPVSGAASVPNTTSVSGFPAQPQSPVTELPSASALPQPPVNQEILPPDVLLQRAGETFDGGNVAAAIALLDQYAEHYP
jgi:hypothetical protein